MVHVAPLVGAWIEILALNTLACVASSLLSWERGLKYLCAVKCKIFLWSLLSWERGLK